MKSLLLLALVILLAVPTSNAQSYFATDNGNVFLFSEAPITNVDAINDKVRVVLNANNQELSFDALMAEFEFKNPKMGKDANSKFLEREKFPTTSFKGKISGNVNYRKPGTYNVTASGKLKIHGVEKVVSEKSTLTVGRTDIKLHTEFEVLLKDFNIETPNILGQAMTSDRVKVTVDATIIPQSHP